MKRREFVKVGSAAGLGFVSKAHGQNIPLENSPQTSEYDVLVVGGGTAGTIAAIQAGRLGAKTILVEAGSQLGGTMTTGGVNFPGLFHAWGKQIIAGIGWELITKTVELNDDELPDFSVVPPHRKHWKHQVNLSGELYACLAEEAAVNAGVEIFYYMFPEKVEKQKEGWKLNIVGKNSAISIHTKMLIDCTGNASVVDMAGFERIRGDEVQPGTLMYQLEGYDYKGLDIEMLQRKYETAIKEGALELGDARSSIGSFLFKGADNKQHIMHADNSTAELHTATNIKGRASLLRMFRFLKEQPGFENLRIKYMQTETAVRETYRIKGETTVSHDDYTSGKVFEDAVAYAFYPIDVHDENGVVPVPLKEGIVPTIPLSALIPKGSKNLIVAGRCISSDRLANSALRVQASCMAMGQAAGAASALSAQNNNTVSKISMAQLVATLEKNNAMLPKF